LDTQLTRDVLNVPRGRVGLLVVLAVAVAAGPAQGQLLLVLNNAGVGEYDAVTGAAINVNVVSFATTQPRYGIAVDGNNQLFASTRDVPANGVSVFNTSTGATINAHFIDAPTSRPFQIAVDDNNHLFVADYNNNCVSEYDATTGATINPLFISGAAPYGLLTDHSNHLFVSYFSGSVGEYNATTGAAINASFVSGINNPFGMALDAMHNHLFVSHFDDATSNRVIGEYDATTGATINSLFINPGGIAAGALELDNNNHLFVTRPENGAVGEYDATTGAIINAAFINQTFPQDLVFVPVPEPSTLLLAGIGFAGFAARGWRRGGASPRAA